MLENQIVQKSSEANNQRMRVDLNLDNSQKIYFNAQAAVAEFDAEEEISAAAIIEKAPARSVIVNAYLRNADLLMKHKDYSLALNLLRQACNKDSKNPQVLNPLVICLEKTGRTQEALIVWKVLTNFDYCFESLFGHATCLYKLDRDQEALDKYYEALAVLTEENAKLFELYKNMGNIFVRKGDFDGAEEFYNKAYTMNSQSDVLLVNLGTLEVQRNDFDKSLYCFRKAVEINPENDKAWVGLAMVHNHFADADLAWANIDSALDINPKNRTAVHLGANWGMRDGKLGKAIEALQTYLGSVEQDEDMSLVLINLFCASGDLDQALLEIERVLLWNPYHEEVLDLKLKLKKSQKVN